MKISLSFAYTGGFETLGPHISELEAAGLDRVFVTEAYSFDAISQVGHLAARTERMEIGTAIVNVYSRTPALLAMTAAGCDRVSDGRFILGIGASGPQVVEGFHGMPFSRPLSRVREVTEICRSIWRREVLDYAGSAVTAPLPDGQGTGLGKPLKLINTPVRPDIPVWWAALRGTAVEDAAANADGWFPFLYFPERAERVWGDALAAGTARRDPSLGPLEISAGGIAAIGEPQLIEEAMGLAKNHIALYVGGMGAKEANFYNDIARAYGFDAEAAEIQERFLAGDRAGAAAGVPEEWVLGMNLIGSEEEVAERVRAYRRAGVTDLNVERVVGDPVSTIRRLKAIVSQVVLEDGNQE